MDQNGSIVQQPQPLKLPNLIAGLLVVPLAGMDDERSAVRSLGTRPAQISAERYTVRPPVPADDAHGKMRVLQLRAWRIVMAHRGDPAEQIPDAAPPEPHRIGDQMLSCDHLSEAMMDVVSPLDVVAIRRPAQPWVKGKLQMIVRIDQSRQDQVAAEIDGRRARKPWRRHVLSNRVNAAASDQDGSASCLNSILRAACSVQQDWLGVAAVQTRLVKDHEESFRAT